MIRKGFRSVLAAMVAALLLAAFASTMAAAKGNSTSVIVGFRSRPDAALIHAAGGTVKRVFSIIPAIAAELPPQAIGGLSRNPRIEYIEEDRLLQALYAPGETVPWGISRIGADAVVSSGNRGWGIKVAVLDTGIDAAHPDLAPNYAGGYDFSNNDPFPDDENGHGTHVSGTVAASDNGQGVVGAGPDISLYALKFLDASGSGSTSAEIAAIEWAVTNGIEVLNMSYGSYFRSRSEQKALDNAYATGMLLVAAAGNDGNSWKLYPAAYDSVIAVAATDQNNNRAGFSSYYGAVELSAPGANILSTMPGYLVYLNLLGYSQDYAYLSGTSMATPHVAGAAALVMRQNPSWSNQQVRDRLGSTAIDLGAPGRDAEYGFGLIDVEAACSTSEPPPPVGETGSITGVVYLNGVPVKGANVSLIDQSGSSVASTKTDSNGTYAFQNVSADNDPATYYTVSGRSKKYTGTSSSVDLTPGQTAVQDLYLQ